MYVYVYVYACVYVDVIISAYEHMYLCIHIHVRVRLMRRRRRRRARSCRGVSCGLPRIKGCEALLGPSSGSRPGALLATGGGERERLAIQPGTEVTVLVRISSPLLQSNIM